MDSIDITGPGLRAEGSNETGEPFNIESSERFFPNFSGGIVCDFGY